MHNHSYDTLSFFYITNLLPTISLNITNLNTSPSFLPYFLPFPRPVGVHFLVFTGKLTHSSWTSTDLFNFSAFSSVWKWLLLFERMIPIDMIFYLYLGSIRSCLLPIYRTISYEIQLIHCLSLFNYYTTYLKLLGNSISAPTFTISSSLFAEFLRSLR